MNQPNSFPWETGKLLYLYHSGTCRQPSPEENLTINSAWKILDETTILKVLPQIFDV